MTASNLGRVQGGGFFGSTSPSTTSIEKSTVQINGVSPLVGDTIVNGIGDLCIITAITEDAYTVSKYGSIKGPMGESPTRFSKLEIGSDYTAVIHDDDESNTYIELQPEGGLKFTGYQGGQSQGGMYFDGNAGTAGQVLVSQGETTLPTWKDIPSQIKIQVRGLRRYYDSDTRENYVRAIIDLVSGKELLQPTDELCLGALTMKSHAKGLSPSDPRRYAYKYKNCCGPKDPIYPSEIFANTNSVVVSFYDKHIEQTTCPIKSGVLAARNYCIYIRRQEGPDFGYIWKHISNNVYFDMYKRVNQTKDSKPYIGKFVMTGE